MRLWKEKMSWKGGLEGLVPAPASRVESCLPDCGGRTEKEAVGGCGSEERGRVGGGNMVVAGMNYAYKITVCCSFDCPPPILISLPKDKQQHAHSFCFGDSSFDSLA
jgi:hypothetical protein